MHIPATNCLLGMWLERKVFLFCLSCAQVHVDPDALCSVIISRHRAPGYRHTYVSSTRKLCFNTSPCSISPVYDPWQRSISPQLPSTQSCRWALNSPCSLYGWRWNKSTNISSNSSPPLSEWNYLRHRNLSFCICPASDYVTLFRGKMNCGLTPVRCWICIITCVLLLCWCNDLYDYIANAMQFVSHVVIPLLQEKLQAAFHSPPAMWCESKAFIRKEQLNFQPVHWKTFKHCSYLMHVSNMNQAGNQPGARQESELNTVPTRSHFTVTAAFRHNRRK